ncbi:MAG: protein TolR [Alphaproteobacteria bacterium]|nr:MAG: protein TolR [Alphaproteobacteria bacterium]
MAAKLDNPGRQGRRGRVRARHRPIAEINVTPMVDVMLVLLVIFMVAAPLLQVGVPVELPETAAAPLPAEEETPLVVSVTKDGRLVIQETEVAADALVPRLRAIAAERKGDKVFLRADGNVPYARVAEVMGALNAAGFHSIGLVTEAGGPTFGGGQN